VTALAQYVATPSENPLRGIVQPLPSFFLPCGRSSRQSQP
jgi:hypothetical protein